MKIQQLVLTNILILLALTLFPVAAQGNVYYVAPGGDDTAPGTADEPWAKLSPSPWTTICTGTAERTSPTTAAN